MVKLGQVPPHSPLQETLTTIASLSARERATAPFHFYGPIGTVHGSTLVPCRVHALTDQGADTRVIQGYLGHRNIQHTVQYTATNPARFERLWR